MTKLKNFDLKKGVDFIGVTCVFFCHDGNGNLLMHKRSKNCRDEQGKWDCGSGSMEFGETFEETVTREVKEEYCVEPSEITLVGPSNVLRKNGETPTHWVAILFVIKVDPKKVGIGEPEKMDDIGWFPLTSLPTPIHSMVPKHLEMVREYL
jgi:8-oxo-dGTP diphosphatase